MRSSSSSSSSGSGHAAKSKAGKEKKEKKGKKTKKKAKKADKDDKKRRKRTERAMAWDCDRAESVRLLRQLLALDPTADTATELEAVFDALDQGETVCLDGLQDQRARKKLRHLLQAMRLAPDGAGFKSSNRKVSFLALFQDCLRKSRGILEEKEGSSVVASGGSSSGPRAARGPAAYPPAPSQLSGEATANGKDSVPPGESALEDRLEAAKASQADPGPPPKPRKVGPQLPMPGVGPGEPGESSEEDAADEDAVAGPRMEGLEREGVDLSDLPEESKREAWMTMQHDSIAGAFSDVPGGLKRDQFSVKRSPEEQAAAEKLFKERGPSLLEQQKEGKFVGHEEEQERVRKRKVGPVDIWGLSSREQEHGGAAVHKASSASRRPFDPDQDLKSTKPMSSESFTKLVDNSVAGLAGRFGRGNLATSFL